MSLTRCDLHLHSNASAGNEWYTRYFDCPESYADPVRQYELCKARGMSLVTLTDHDTIDGGLKLLDRPDFFLSEEITTAFPENDCVVHVLAWNITPAQHDHIQARRNDVYKLVEYLNGAAIAHGLAHPLMGPNWKLNAGLIEKLLVLFPTLESVNGLTDARIEPDLPALLKGLDPDRLAALARKHNLTANGSTPHVKAFTGGSDDHVHRRCATVFTEVDGAHVPRDFLDACLAGQARVIGEQGHLDAMALSVHHTLYHHLKERRVDRPDYRDPFVEMMDVIAGRGLGDGDGEGRNGNGPAHPAAGFLASLVSGAQRASLAVGKELDILEVPVSQADEDDARLIGSIARLGDTVVENALEELLAGAQDFDLYRIFAAFRDLTGGLVTTAPVFAAADHFGKQEQQVRRIWEQWSAWPLPARPERLAVFSDSLEQVDVVSTWCKRFVGQARAAGREVLIPYCGELPGHVEDSSSFHVLPSSTSFNVPLSPRLRFHVPSLIDTLRWVWAQGISHVELSTPGPMGLVGLLVAKVLRLPVTASYHTEVSALVQPLGGNPLIARAAKRYLSWFYGRADRVFAFSPAARDDLAAMGVAVEKLAVLPVTGEPEQASPAQKADDVLAVPFNRIWKSFTQQI